MVAENLKISGYVAHSTMVNKKLSQNLPDDQTQAAGRF